MKPISYDFQEGQLVQLFEGRPQASWDIYSVPNEMLESALAWNDSNGDFDGLERVTLLEIFLSDFIQSKKG
jgi:hypothetical protein